MPYVIKTKDGIQIEGVPDGIPADDPRLKAQVAQLRASGQKTASFLGTTITPGGMGGLRVAESKVAEPSPAALSTPSKGAEGTTAEGLMGAVVRGAGPIATGAALGAGIGLPIGGVGAVPGAVAGAGAAGLTMLVGDPIISGINSLFGTKYTLPSEALEDLFTRIGVAEPKTEAERLVQSISAGSAGAGGTVALGQALKAGVGLSPSAAKTVGEALASGPMQQILGGAGSGGASQAASEAGASPLVRLGAGLAGGVATAGLGGIKTTPIPAAPIKEAQQAGIRLMTSDVRPPSTFAGKWLRAVGEKIPVVGTGSARMTQQAERVDAVRDIVRQFGAEDLAAASDDVMKDLLGKRSADLTKWSTAKNEVINNLSPDTNMGPIAKVVPMPATLQKVDDSIATLKQLKTEQVNPVISVLEDWKQAVQGQDLRNVELLRKQIGEAFKAPELASVRSTGERVLSEIYGAVKDDMTSYIKTEGGEKALTKWQVANKELSKMMGELELPALKSAIDRGEATPEAINSLLFSKKHSDVEALYRNLSPSGQASARSAILARAVEKSGGADVSPDRFSSEVKKLGDQVGVMFSGDDLRQVNGLVRVLDATKRAGQAAAMPPTGVQAVLPAGAAALASFFGGGLEGFIGTMSAGAAAGGAARLYESKAVRDILVKLPTVKVGSPEEAGLFKRLLEAAQATQQSSSASGGSH